MRVVRLLITLDEDFSRDTVHEGRFNCRINERGAGRMERGEIKELLKRNREGGERRSGVSE